jgi:FADH2 O2-dependent halogenase
MKRIRTDIVVLGSGFAGSLLALMVRRSREVVLIERGRHPRFALGESSTPLANLALEEIARDYDLPWLMLLTEYGSWKRHYPHLVCGLKRGFTFVEHHAGREFVPDRDHRNELLVAASPRDEVADTQWLRADFDHFIVTKAVESGIPYFDRTELNVIEPGKPWRLAGRREGEEIEIIADFVVDASGASGALARAMGLREKELRTESYAVFSHFEEVERWEELVAQMGGDISGYPYHADDAALHHIIDGGWMYVLPFDTGLVSAGFLLWGRPESDQTPEEQWHSLLREFPSIGTHFGRARAVRPIERSRRLQRFVPECAGANWAMLAPAAYTMDALFSTGNAHALMTVQRLAHLLIEQRSQESDALLTRYAPALCDEVRFIDLLVSTAYRAMKSFPLFAAWSMYYFAGAIASEERRRQGRAGGDERFLSSHLHWFRESVEKAAERVFEIAEGREPDAKQVEAFARQVAEDIAPINTVGLCDPGKRNLYPYE